MSARKLPAHAVWAVLCGLVLWLAIALVAVVALWYERTQAIDYAKDSAEATVALMEQHTAATFRAVELALEDTARRLADHDYPRDDPRLRELMRGLLRDMPYVRAFFVVDANGTIIHDTDFPTTPKLSLADRPYFRAHKDDPALVTSISSPLQSRSGVGWFVPVTRRIEGAGFRGIVVAAIRLGYFNDLYLRMGLNEGQHIVLFHSDGTLLAQYPAANGRVGSKYLEYPLFKVHLPAAQRGVFETGGPPVGYDRIFSYAALDGQPLVVGMAHKVDAVLASWKRTVAFTVFGLSLLLMIVVAAVAQFIYHESQRQHVRERLLQGEKLEALGQLTGGIAHDFGNLLGIIGNCVELLDQLVRQKDEHVVRALSAARHAVDTGRRLTGDLMSFARKRELQVNTVDLQDVLVQSLPMLRQAVGPNVKLDVSAEPQALCELDYSQLEVALVNLVVNARDAMRSEGTIEIRGRSHDKAPRRRRSRAPAGEFVSITVSDTGPGMADDVRKRALEPFFTTKGEDGTGLGLSQVYGFVKQVGGELAIDSAPGRGTSVHLYFPAAHAWAPDAVTTPSRR
jgi:signal transduction histidine kinase